MQPMKDEIRQALIEAGAVDLLGREVRTVKVGTIEVRQDEAAPVLHGDAAVFNTPTVIAGLFEERLDPRAFNKTLADGADVRHLFNHDPNLVLGRTKSGTTRLRAVDTALQFETDVNQKDTDAMNLVARVERGDIDQSSFAMRVIDEEWEHRDGELPRRVILEAQLFDVSTVTYPAYEAASTMVRAAQLNEVGALLGLGPDEITALKDGDISEVRTALDHLVERVKFIDGEVALPKEDDVNDEEPSQAAEEAPAEEQEEAPAAEEAPVDNENDVDDERSLRLQLQIRARHYAKDKEYLSI